MTLIAVIDCETNGTELWRHDLWELGAVRFDTDGPGELELLEWRSRLEYQLANSSPDALRVNHYLERERGTIGWVDRAALAREAQYALDGRVIAGCNVGFDAAFTMRLLVEHQRVPTWGYSPIDVKSLCYGKRPSTFGMGTSALLKDWGIDVERTLRHHCPGSAGRHSALGDAVLATELLHLAMGWGSTVPGVVLCGARRGTYRCDLPWPHPGQRHGAPEMLNGLRASMGQPPERFAWDDADG